MKSILSCLGFILVVAHYPCLSQPYLSYETRTYTGSNGVLRDMQMTSRFLSCGDGLIEFRLRVNVYDSMTAGGPRITYKIEYDTLACLYLDQKTRKYYQIDTFSIQHRVIGMGSFEKKTEGVPISKYPKLLDPDMIPQSIRDTLVDGILCKAADFTGESSKEIGPQKMTVVFRNDVRFNSIFANTSYLKQHPDWIPVSYFVVALNVGDAYMIRIENLSNASESAKQIFDAIRKTVHEMQARESK